MSVETKIKVKGDTKLKNQDKVSYILVDLPYSSAVRYNWRLDDDFAARDGVCKAEGQ